MDNLKIMDDGLDRRAVILDNVTIGWVHKWYDRDAVNATGVKVFRAVPVDHGSKFKDFDRFQSAVGYLLRFNELCGGTRQLACPDTVTVPCPFCSATDWKARAEGKLATVRVVVQAVEMNTTDDTAPSLIHCSTTEGHDIEPGDALLLVKDIP